MDIYFNFFRAHLQLYEYKYIPIYMREERSIINYEKNCLKKKKK